MKWITNPKWLYGMIVIILAWFGVNATVHAATMPLPVPAEYDCQLYAKHMWFGADVRARGAELKFEYTTQDEVDRLEESGQYDLTVIYIALDGMTEGHKAFIENTARVGWEAMDSWIKHAPPGELPDFDVTIANFTKACEWFKTKGTGAG